MLSVVTVIINRIYKMFRSISILFVALAIFQTVYASDGKQRRIINLELLNLASPTTDSFDDALAATKFIGDLTVGDHLKDEFLYGEEFEFENGQNTILSFELGVTIPNGTIHFVNAKNKKNSTVVICDTPLTLGSSKAVMNLRMPPNSKPKIVFTVAAH